MYIPIFAWVEGSHRSSGGPISTWCVPWLRCFYPRGGSTVQSWADPTLMTAFTTIPLPRRDHTIAFFVFAVKRVLRRFRCTVGLCVLLSRCGGWTSRTSWWTASRQMCCRPDDRITSMSYVQKHDVKEACYKPLSLYCTMLYSEMFCLVHIEAAILTQCADQDLHSDVGGI